jgi:hypothetical protein
MEDEADFDELKEWTDKVKECYLNANGTLANSDPAKNAFLSAQIEEIRRKYSDSENYVAFYLYQVLKYVWNDLNKEKDFNEQELQNLYLKIDLGRRSIIRMLKENPSSLSDIELVYAPTPKTEEYLIELERELSIFSSSVDVSNLFFSLLHLFIFIIIWLFFSSLYINLPPCFC